MNRARAATPLTSCEQLPGLASKQSNTTFLKRKMHLSARAPANNALFWNEESVSQALDNQDSRFETGSV